MNDKSFIIEQPKTQSSRRQVPISPASVDNLRVHPRRQSTIDPDRLDFATRTGKPYSPHTLSQRFSRMVRAAGLSVRFHDLRHTHASLLLAAGVHPKVVQERLGHSSIAMTLDVYSHLAPGWLEGLMFWLRWNTLLGSYRAFKSARRAYRSRPHAARIRVSSSPARKFRYAPPLECVVIASKQHLTQAISRYADIRRKIGNSDPPCRYFHLANKLGRCSWEPASLVECVFGIRFWCRWCALVCGLGVLHE